MRYWNPPWASVFSNLQLTIVYQVGRQGGWAVESLLVRWGRAVIWTLLLAHRCFPGIPVQTESPGWTAGEGGAWFWSRRSCFFEKGADFPFCPHSSSEPGVCDHLQPGRRVGHQHRPRQVCQLDVHPQRQHAGEAFLHLLGFVLTVSFQGLDLLVPSTSSAQ